MYCEQEDSKVYSLHVKDLSQKIRCGQTIHHIETRFGLNILVFSMYFGDSPYQLYGEGIGDSPYC
jgi:hypothetical protein